MKYYVQKWLKILVGLLITALALWLSFRKLDLGILAASFSKVNLFWVILAIANVIFCVYALGWRWQFLLNPKDRLPMKTLFRLNILSQYVNIIAPGRFGEIFRSYLGSRESRISTAYFLGTVAVEKIFDFLIFAALWLLIPVLFALKEQVQGSAYALLVCFLAAFLLILITRHPRIFLKEVIFFSSILPKKIRQSAISFLEKGLEAFKPLKSPKAFLSVLGLTIFFVISQVLTNFFLFKAFHLRLSFWAALFLLLAVQAGNIPPSAPGKIGIFEYAVILALSVFHIPKSQAFGYGIMLHVVAFLPKILLGLLFFSSMDIGRLKRDRNDVEVNV